MSLQIKNISYKQSNKYKQKRNRISTKFNTERTENEESFKMKFDVFKNKAYISIEKKI